MVEVFGNGTGTKTDVGANIDEKIFIALVSAPLVKGDHMRFMGAFKKGSGGDDVVGFKKEFNLRRTELLKNSFLPFSK